MPDSSVANPKRTIGPAALSRATQSVRTNSVQYLRFRRPPIHTEPPRSANTKHQHCCVTDRRGIPGCVTKSSYVFASARAAGAGAIRAVSQSQILGRARLSLPAHLESSVSTLGSVPAVAIIELHYVRGKVNYSGRSV